MEVKWRLTFLPQTVILKRVGVGIGPAADAECDSGTGPSGFMSETRQAHGMPLRNRLDSAHAFMNLTEEIASEFLGAEFFRRYDWSR